MKKCLSIIMLILVMSATVFIVNVENVRAADKIFVGGTGPGNYSKIQDAIDNANLGDTVFVYNGIYTENIDIDKSIFIEGENLDHTIINNNGGDHTVAIVSDYVSISGFTINGSSSSSYYGIFLKSNNSHISENKLTNNVNGIKLESSNNNIISNNEISESDDCLKLWESNYNEIFDNVIFNCDDGFNIYSDSRYNNISGNDFNNIDYNAIDLKFGSSDNIVFDNDIQYVDKGVLSYGSGSNTLIKKNNIRYYETQGIIVENYGDLCNYVEISNNVIRDGTSTSYAEGSAAIFVRGTNFTTINNNFISDNEGGGIYLFYCYSPIISNNYIYENGYGLILDYCYGITEVEANVIQDIGKYYPVEIEKTNNINFLENEIITENGNFTVKFVELENLLFSENSINTDTCVYFDKCYDMELNDNDFIKGGFTFTEGGDATGSGNTINGKKLELYNGISSDIIQGNDVGQVILFNCDNIEMRDLTITDTDIGIQLYNSNNCIIDNCNIHSNFFIGITLERSEYITISNNTIDNTYIGCADMSHPLFKKLSNYTRYVGNTFTNNEHALSFSSKRNNIFFNNFLNNDHDISGDNPDCNNTKESLYMYNGETYSSVLGNYWDNYTGVDNDGDGVGDTTYNGETSVGQDFYDYYPLIDPFENYEIMPENNKPNANFNYNPSNPLISETVDFDASASYDSDGSIVSYKWDFDNDGYYDDRTGEEVSWTWYYLGDYPVTLKVEDNYGKTDRITKTITVSEPENNPPEASGNGPYYEYINTDIYFDGSSSSDMDGSISSYSWDFGDGNTASTESTTHSYIYQGNYTVTLTVTDDDGDSDTYTSFAVISKPNTPPAKPIITGPTEGKQNKKYNFTFKSIDTDNDYLNFIIDWGDGEQTTTSYYIQSTNVKQQHKWDKPGKYIIKARSNDDETISEKKTFTILIDIYPIDNIVKGYLLDEDSDGIYDKFHDEKNNTESVVDKQKNGEYLIDTDDDGKWDYRYNLSSNTISDYVSSSGEKNSQNKKDKESEDSFISSLLNNPLIIVLLAIVVLIIIAAIVFLKYRKKEQQPYQDPLFIQNNQTFDTQNEQEKFEQQPFKTAGPVNNIAYTDENSQPAGDVDSQTNTQTHIEKQPQTTMSGSEESVLNFCPECGSKIVEDNQSFCVECGEKIKQ